jgi:hypothetical protein
MRASSCVAIAALLCGLVAVRVTLQGQTQSQKTAVPDHASQLAEEKIEVSKLDWILLKARVRLLEQMAAHDGSRPASAVGMAYDSQEKRVVVKGFVDPDWVAKAKLDEVKKVLLKQSADYCVDGLAMAEAEAGEILAGTNAKTDCSVDFFTWTTNKSGNLTVKDVATAQGGQLLLK